jgi:hypothetical protein
MDTKTISISRTAKIVGALILFRFVVGVLGFFFKSASDDLQKIAQHISEIRFGLLLGLLTGIASISTAILLYPILKRYSGFSALWFLGFSIIGFAILLEGNASVFCLTQLSQAFIDKKPDEAAVFQVLATQLETNYTINHFWGLIIHSIGAFAFYWLLFQEKMVPRFISIFALIAVTLVVINTFLQIFEVKSSMFMYLPNGILQILLGIWFMTKGFAIKTYETI